MNKVQEAADRDRIAVEARTAAEELRRYRANAGRVEQAKYLRASTELPDTSYPPAIPDGY